MTQDILRVQTKEEHYETAYGFLSTQIGFRLLRSCAVGTKILTMRTDLLARLPFPSLDTDSQRAVRSHVANALLAKDAADAAEAEAARIVEEEVLPQWLA
jgi:type I restriction enzyme S subunit